MSQASRKLVAALFQLSVNQGSLKNRLASALNVHVQFALPHTLPPELAARLEALFNKMATVDPLFPKVHSRIQATVWAMKRNELRQTAEELVSLCLAVVRHEGPVP